MIYTLDGQEFDITLDDWVFRSDLPPLFLTYIGWRLSTAGSFNGDEYDDFVFSCQNFAYGDPGDVFVIKGSPDIVTDVFEPRNENLPDQFTLKQNCPNPFNNCTVIEFDLPVSDIVELGIYNILGEKVVTLLEGKSFPAGIYRVSWNGSLKNGTPVSSGVYLYKMSVGEKNAERKMLLIK